MHREFDGCSLARAYLDVVSEAQRSVVVVLLEHSLLSRIHASKTTIQDAPCGSLSLATCLVSDELDRDTIDDELARVRELDVARDGTGRLDLVLVEMDTHHEFHWCLAKQPRHRWGWEIGDWEIGICVWVRWASERGSERMIEISIAKTQRDFRWLTNTLPIQSTHRIDCVLLISDEEEAARGHESCV